MVTPAQAQAPGGPRHTAISSQITRLVKRSPAPPGDEAKLRPEGDQKMEALRDEDAHASPEDELLSGVPYPVRWPQNDARNFKDNSEFQNELYSEQRTSRPPYTNPANRIEQARTKRVSTSQSHICGEDRESLPSAPEKSGLLQGNIAQRCSATTANRASTGHSTSRPLFSLFPAVVDRANSKTTRSMRLRHRHDWSARKSND